MIRTAKLLEVSYNFGIDYRSMIQAELNIKRDQCEMGLLVYWLIMRRAVCCKMAVKTITCSGAYFGRVDSTSLPTSVSSAQLAKSAISSLPNRLHMSESAVADISDD